MYTDPHAQHIPPIFTKYNLVYSENSYCEHSDIFQHIHIK